MTVKSARNLQIMSLIVGSEALVLDRIHKYVQLDVQGWSGGEFVEVAPFLDYVLVWNRGVSYGLLTGLPQQLIYLIIGAAAAFLAVWWLRATSFLTLLGLSFCLFGAASNFIDRMIYGAVADFFHLHWGSWSFFVFNIADASITLGAILLIFDMLRPQQEIKP